MARTVGVLIAAVAAVAVACSHGFSLGPAMKSPYLAHSFDDLAAHTQLLAKGTRWFKLDVALATMEACTAYSTWNGSTSDCVSFKGKTLCCLALRGDTSSAPNLPGPFNTTDDLLAWAAATPAYRDTSTVIYWSMDFVNLMDYDPVSSPVTPMLTKFVLALNDTIVSNKLNVQPILDSTISGWLMDLDKLCLANNCTAAQRQLHSLPWVANSGGPSSPADDPLHRVQVLNFEVSGLSDICNADFYSPDFESYPYWTWEPSSQSAIVSALTTFQQCPHVPASHQSISNGLLITCNQGPEMFQVFAAGVTHGLDGSMNTQMPASFNLTNTMQTVVNNSWVVTCGMASSGTSFTVQVSAVTAPLQTVSDSVTQAVTTNCGAPIALHDVEGGFVLGTAAGCVWTASVSAAGKITGLQQSAVAAPAGHTFLDVSQACSAKGICWTVALSVFNQSDVYVHAFVAESAKLYNSSVVARGLTSVTAGGVDVGVFEAIPGGIMGLIAVASTDNSGLLGVRYGTIGLQGQDDQPQMFVAFSESMNALGTQVAVDVASVQGTLFAVSVHSEGMCQFGIGFNNGNQDHCSPLASLPGALLNTPLLLNYEFGPLDQFATAVQSGELITACSSTLIQGKYDNGVHPTAALYTTADGTVSVLEFHTAVNTLTSPLLGFCGESTFTSGAIWDAWALVQPDSWFWQSNK